MVNCLTVLRSHLWMAQCFGQIPSAFDALSESRVRHSSEPRPFGNAMRLSVKSQISDCSRVVGLSKIVCPPTVVLRVTGVIVDAVQRVACRALAHVGVEIFKRAPSFANGYPSTAITTVVRRIRIGASGHHCAPASECRGNSAAFRHAVAGNDVAMKASATARVSVLERIPNDGNFSATVAPTEPVDFALYALAARVDGSQSSESLAVKLKRVHRWLAMCASMILRTSSATEIPSLLASRFRNTRCGSVNEIICFVMGLVYVNRGINQPSPVPVSDAGFCERALKDPPNCRRIWVDNSHCDALMRNSSQVRLMAIRQGDLKALREFQFDQPLIANRDQPHGQFSPSGVADFDKEMKRRSRAIGGYYWHTLSIPRGIHAS